ncbi:hypothetical protein KDL01_10930 [Actinospica durhamensis]|uniref:Uncharacterized protein n=1 Tax=Actinospica durhamensis TaxID=1508375 RepID=A0A941ENP1_9ACTN|nr:hypothetical protein [Actinospica durhamensis]MBR7833782.1 hypothetical protein [Actinospica durhamensis]
MFSPRSPRPRLDPDPPFDDTDPRRAREAAMGDSEAVRDLTVAAAAHDQT